MTFDELLERARADLDTIEDNLRWAFYDGFQPSNADPARIAGTNTQDLFGRDDPPPDKPQPEATTTDPDTIPAAKHNIGIGDHRSRQTYHHAARHLAEAELHLAHALNLHHLAQPALTNPTPNSPLDHVLLTIAYLRIRLDLARNTTLNPTARTHARKATRRIAKTWHDLNRNFERGEINPDTHAYATRDLCRICHIRPRAERTGGRCHTCSKWFQRNRFERPTHLDSVADAQAAQRRRRARGEGWGDESLSGTRP